MRGSNFQDERIDSLDEFANWLCQKAKNSEFNYRGQSCSGWPLLSSLDRKFLEVGDRIDLLSRERKLVEDFVGRSSRFLGSLERNLLSNLPPEDLIVRMTVMQHYGAPTRLLDWTRSPAVAAYFACIEDWDCDGAIWWFNAARLNEVLDRRWESVGASRGNDGKIDLNHHVFRADAKAFVSPVYLTIPFRRAEAQRGLFTMCSHFRTHHEDILAQLLGSGYIGKVRIGRGLKKSIIEYLECLGIDAVSLHHAGADRVGLRMSWECEQNSKQDS